MSMTTEYTVNSALATRILREGYGDGAWHGPDLKAALSDLSSEIDFWRPGPERHNIAEIALHHAFHAHNVRAKLLGAKIEPFVLVGDDWFELQPSSPLSWAQVLEIVDREHQQLAKVAADTERTAKDAAIASERLDLVLGITCHGVYHAGQIQLIKRLAASR